MKNNFTRFILNFVPVTLFKRVLFITALFILITSAVQSQTSIQVKLQQPPPNQLSIADLYNIELNNASNSDVEFYLYGTLNESRAGLIASATTIPIKLKAKERRRFKASDLPKTPEVSYPSRDNRYKEALMRKGSLPDGNYTICVYAKQTGTNDELGSDCKDNEIKILQETEITLLMPENNSEIEQTRGLNFIWTVFGGQTGACKIKIVEIKGDESPDNAFKGNKPFFESDSIPGKTTTYQVPASGPKFVPGKKYAWRVSMGKYNSEVSSFMIAKEIKIQQETGNCSYQIIQKEGNCCWVVKTTQPEDKVRRIRLTPIDAGTIFTSSSVYSGLGFQIQNQSELLIRPAPPNQTFQSGPNEIVEFCLGYESTVQKVKIEWLGGNNNNEIIRVDTITAYCSSPCIEKDSVHIECGVNGWVVNFNFRNISTFPISKVEIIEVLNSSATVSPSIFNFTPNVPNNTSNSNGNMNFVITNAQSGSELCLVVKYLSPGPDFCCSCIDTLCIQIPNCICDSAYLDAKLINGDSHNCCYDLRIKNLNITDFTHILLNTLDAGVYFNSVHNYGNWMGSTFGSQPNQIWIDSPSPILTGNNMDVLRFCLGGYTNTTQYIELKWMRNDSVICRDTLVTNCIPPPPPTECSQIVEDTLICNADGTFTYNFRIRNNSSSPSFNVRAVKLQPVSPLTIQPTVLTTDINGIPLNVAPGMISPVLSQTFSNITSNSDACFQIAIYDGVDHHTHCCWSDEICVSVPQCTVSTGCLDLIRVENINCINQNTGGGFDYSFNITINNTTSSPIANTLTTQCGGTLSGLPASFIPGTNQYTGTLSTTNPNLTQCCIIYSDAVCVDEVCFNLPKCVTTSGCLDLLSVDSVVCIGKNATGGFNYSFNITINNPTSSPISASTLTSQCGGIITGLPSTFAVGTHQYSGTISTPYPGVPQCCLLYQNGSCIDQICFNLPQGCNEPLCFDLVKVENMICLGPNVSGGNNYQFSLTINNQTSGDIMSSVLTNSCGASMILSQSIIWTGINTYTVTLSTFNTNITSCCIIYNGACSDEICFDLANCNSGSGCLDLIKVENINCSNQNAGGGFDYSFSITINNPTSSPIANTLTTQCGGSLSGLPASFAPGTNQYTGTLSTTNPNLTQCCIIYSNALCIREVCFNLPKCLSENCHYEIFIDSILCIKTTPTNWNYYINARINNLSGASATLTGISVNNGVMNCTPLTLSTGMNTVGCTYFVTAPVANPTCFTFKFLRSGSPDTCKIEVCQPLPCIPPSSGCNCINGKWNNNGTVRFLDNEISTDENLKCNTTYTVDNNSAVSIYPGYTCPQPNCSVNYAYRINNGALSGYQASPFNIPNINTNTNVTIYAYCGDNVCDSCNVTFKPSPSQCKFEAQVKKVECKSLDQNGNPIYLVEFNVTNPVSTPVTLNSITSGNGTLISPYLPDAINSGTSSFYGTFIKNSNSGNTTCFNFSFTDPKTPKDTCKVIVCTDLPDCFKPPEKPCEIKSKVIEVKCKGKDEKGNPLYYIEIKIDNSSGSPTVLSSITSNNLSFSNGNLPAVLNPGSTTLDFGFSMSGEPVSSTCFTFSYTDPKNPKDTCKETVCTDLPKCEETKDCGCDKNWSGSIKVGSTTIGCNSKVLKTVNAGQTTITAPVYNCTASCAPKYKYTVKKSGQTITSGTSNSNSFSYNFPAGTYTIIYEVYCGEKLCGECKVTVIFSGGTEGPK